MYSCYREVGKQTQSFAAALKAALREDPDVILVGEMRDFEFCQVLRMLTGGEAKSLIKDQESGTCAWLALQSVFARNTLARALRLHREVLNPGQSRTSADVITNVNTW